MVRSLKTSNGTTHLIRQVNKDRCIIKDSLCGHTCETSCCILLELSVLPVQSSGTLLTSATPLEFWQRRPATQERHMAGSRSPDFIDCLMKMRGALMWHNPTPPIRKDPVSAEVFMPRIKGMSSYRLVGHKDTHHFFIFLGWTFACL